MTWREELARVTLPDGRKLVGASFRGVAFFVESSDRSGGARRSIKHEFYGSNEPEIGDAGGEAVDYRVEGYVIGDDYMRQRDALIIALGAKEGPGELVHPYYGRKRAVCSSLNIRESVSSGGIAMLSIGFDDAPARPSPTEIPDLSGAVETAAADALLASQVEFVAAYDVAGQPSFATDSLRSDLASVSVALKSSLSDVVETTQELASMSAEIDILSSNASALVRLPEDVLDDLLSAVRQLATSIENAPLAMAKALLDVYAEPAPAAVLGDTTTRDQERANQTALGDALRRTLVIEAVRLLPSASFESTDQAEEMRDAGVAALDDLAASAGNTAYPALVLLRAALIRAVPGDSELARVQTIERNVDVPSLLIAHQIFGDVDKEADIIARNGVRHPAFVSGSIKVLGDV